jgi:uncharacterized protein (TIGR02145 family)
MLGISIIKTSELQRLRHIDGAFNSLISEKDSILRSKEETIDSLKYRFAQLKAKYNSANNTDNYVLINGLKWDRENIVIDGKRHFNFDEAQEVARSKGKRLPTKEEWEALADLGSTWDKEKKGRWFGHDHELKEASKQSVFLPAAGYRRTDGVVYGIGTHSIYWSSTVTGITAYNLLCSSAYVYPSNAYYQSNGHSVRCVSGI